MTSAQQVGLREKVVRSLCKMGLMRLSGFGSVSALYGPNLGSNKKFTVDYYGSRYQGKIDNRTDWKIYFFGERDAARVNFVREIANFVGYRTGKPFHCYDIGANRGDFCLALVDIADGIIAFERSPERFSHLAQNIADSGAENVKAFNIGLGDTDEQAVAPNGIKTARRNVSEPAIGLTGGEPYSSPGEVKRADPFIENGKLEHPDFVRINAGSDYRSVLQGLRSTLELSQPVIFIEQSVSHGSPYANETALRSVLYEDAKLYTFVGSSRGREFRLDKFDAEAPRIVCYPAKIDRMITHEVSKMGGLRMLPSRR